MISFPVFTRTYALRRGHPNVIVRALTNSAPSRRRDYAKLTPADISFFTRVVGDNAVIRGDALAAYNTDWMGRYTGSASLALRPRSTAAVSQILAHCHARRIAVVPQGGNTGLVGGSVPVFDEVILSLGAMDKVDSFDDAAGIIVAEAGVVLGKLIDYADARGYRVPLDIGAKRRCQIGGNVATNAGGSRFLRYGSLRGSVTGLEVVLPDGRVLDVLSTVLKDNTGYDLKQMHIGGEGSLGVITKVAIACPAKSGSILTAVVRVADFDRVRSLLQLARERLGEILSAYEFMDAQSVAVATKLPHVRHPMSGGDDDKCCYVLIETAGSVAEHDRAKLDRFVRDAFEAGLAADSVIAESEDETDTMWMLRESLPAAMLRAGAGGGTLKYDVSLPLTNFYDIVTDARQRAEGKAEVFGWGHIGDGNLHLNVAIPEESNAEAVKALMEPWVYEWVQGKRGSISAEHGLGQMKMDAIHYSKDDVAVDLMQSLKEIFDPHAIMNPYKLLPRRKTQTKFV